MEHELVSRVDGLSTQVPDSSKYPLSYKPYENALSYIKVHLSTAFCFIFLSMPPFIYMVHSSNILHGIFSPSEDSHQKSLYYLRKKKNNLAHPFPADFSVLISVKNPSTAIA